jgi:exopolysaccharide/PEP-CTERM locus tyrosine autokinase
MSLVEQAIKKLQAARVAEPRKPAPVPVPAAAPDSRPPVTRSTRIVPVNRLALHEAGVLPPAEDERVIAEEYRQIKRPLIANALGRGVPQLAKGKLIMLASALPGDGKTFTSINLALSLAMEKDIHTLLVDADVAKPHISKLFGVENELGLLDVLRDENLDVESVILSTQVPGLSILPAGKHCETATELLASARMETIAAHLLSSDATRIVLFDSPPLLLTTESRALAAVVGQIVLVVGAGVTPQKAVFDALELLGDHKSIGLVMNQSEEGTRNGYYRYYGQGSGTTTQEV